MLDPSNDMTVLYRQVGGIQVFRGLTVVALQNYIFYVLL